MELTKPITESEFWDLYYDSLGSFQDQETTAHKLYERLVQEHIILTAKQERTVPDLWPLGK